MRKVLAILAFIVVAAVTGTMDFEDALQSQREYCNNVAAGVWPDYNQNANHICTKP